MFKSSKLALPIRKNNRFSNNKNIKGLTLVLFSYNSIGDGMKKLLLVVTILFLSCSNKVYASTDTAYEYILMDMNTKRVLAGKNYNNRALIASITKIMTM